MVGEGVLMECLDNDSVSEILIVGRKHFDIQHAKVKELLVSDFNHISNHKTELENYDACFYCAGVSSVGMDEPTYTRITYDTTLNFAKALYEINPKMVFNFVTGAQTKTDGKQMWQRVKGKTEDDLMKIGFSGQYNFRPGFMSPMKGQKNVRWFFKPIIAVFPLLFPKNSLTLKQVGRAMIHSVNKGYSQQVLEIKDIKILSE